MPPPANYPRGAGRSAAARRAYLAVFGSALAYTAYTWLLGHSPADRVGTFAYVNPAIAAVLGWAVLGESLEPMQVAGMLVVLAGVALVTLRSERLRAAGAAVVRSGCARRTRCMLSAGSSADPAGNGCLERPRHTC